VETREARRASAPLSKGELSHALWSRRRRKGVVGRYRLDRAEGRGGVASASERVYERHLIVVVGMPLVGDVIEQATSVDDTLEIRERSPRACNQWLERSRSSLFRTCADAAGVTRCAGAAHDNRPLPLSDFRHRAEGEDSPPSREETATADDDLVGVVGVPLVADVIQPPEVRAVAGEHSVAPGDGEEPTEFRLCPVAPLVPATLLHGREE
jgi:hypothetical protein